MRGAAAGQKHTLTTKAGVISGVGKVHPSSVSLIIQSMAHKVSNIKIDSYINLDVATLSPYQLSLTHTDSMAKSLLPMTAAKRTSAWVTTNDTS
jgi:hypothetical protein